MNPMDHFLWRYYWGADGTLDTKIKAEIDMSTVRIIRDEYLVKTDTWMTLDRNDTLTVEQQTYLTGLRQALRDLPQYEDAWEAAANFPDVEDWI